MSKKPYPAENSLEAILRLGEMVYSRTQDADARAYFEALVEGGDTEEWYTPFVSLCEALALEPPEAMSVALWLYIDSSPLPSLTVTELQEHYRRIGGRLPRQTLGRMFIASGETIMLHPVIEDFLLEREPRLPHGVELIIPRHVHAVHAEDLLAQIDTLLQKYMEKPFPLVVTLCGNEGGGRKFLISQLCARMGATMLRADLRERIPSEELVLAARLYGAAVCLEYARDAAQVAEIIKGTGFAFLLCESSEAPPESPDYTIFRREAPPLEPDMRQRLLRDALEGIPFSEDALPDIGAHGFGFGRIQALGRSLKAEHMATGQPLNHEIFQRILREKKPLQIDGAQILTCRGTLDDLALPADLARQLAELCAFAKARDTVYKSWGFAEKVPWGRGISALFYGAPGTGKTMAAAVMANETGLPLLRVDISQLISKYIGETQKNIGKIFDQALQNDCILFFDEADAVFAKRTESADAQDKYANAETAYLLQRMEGYDGVCILATNLLQNFDEAFRRRIHYMLHFPLPDVALREKIWRGIFPAEAPTEDLDWVLLARQLELSGASIKNCAVHAAYLAAINGTKISMAHILAGAKNEYQKQGKSISPQLLQMTLL